jgi:excisionase family DNA binding protein
MRMTRLLTVRELAGAFHLHPQTVYRWKREGLLPFVSLGAKVRFDEDEVERFIRERRILTRPLPLPKVDFSLDGYDRLLLKGGRKALSKDSRRWNYGIGSVSARKTKQGHDRWYLDYRSKEGERRREVARYARTRAEAVGALQSRVAQEFNRRFGVENPTASARELRFEEFADRFIRDCAEKTKRSADTDRYRLRPILEAFGEAKLSEITKTMLLEFREGRLKAGISRASTNRELMLLSKMFSWAEAEGFSRGNPARGIKKFSEADTIRSRVLSEDEEARLLRELALHARPVVLVALHAGLRRGEILGLPWKNVDLGKRVLTVEGTKSGKARIVPVNSLLADVLGKLKALGRDRVKVFPFKNVTTAFEKACRRAGLEDFHFHDLRRTFGTRLLERGADIVTVSRLLGHSSVVTTQRYLHPSDSLAGEAVERLAEGKALSGRFSENLSNGGQTARRVKPGVPANPVFSLN